MIEMIFTLKKETKNSYCFENDGPHPTSLYLKKQQVKEADMDPNREIVVTIKQREGN